MKKNYYARRRRHRRKARRRFYVIVSLLIIALGAGIYLIITGTGKEVGNPQKPNEIVDMTAPDGSATLPSETEQPTPAPPPELADTLVPQPTQGTNPSDIQLTAEIMDNGEEKDTYQRTEPISFGPGDEYTTLEGIIGFRGNNYRDTPSWGAAEIVDETLTLKTTKETGATGKWGGIAWTGQPLIVKWPEKTRTQMTMLKEEFRSKEDFVEVIYASLSGYVYFMDLETGDKTRSALYVGGPVKGTPSLDPRGYPILYVGQGLAPDGDDNSADDIYFRAFSLIDGELKMKVGAPDQDPFAHRQNWQAYDASPLIDAETDTLIYPGENGVLYICDLNTSYNDETGELTMDMDPKKVKYRYTTPRNQSADEGAGGRWGIEDSPVAWRNYIMFTDNVGILQCVDLNTLQPVYANNLFDDSDVSMVLEEAPADQTIYLYTGCEYDELVRPSDQTGPNYTGTAYARKINGLTGEVMWEIPYTVQSDGDVDGGILASPVLGKEGTTMEGLIIYNVTAEVKGDTTTSRVVALNKDDGTEVWSYDMDVAGWSPSSPVPVYTSDGKGYIVQCDKAGDVALIDGATGTEVTKLNVGEYDNFEATPAVYGNTIVVGSRNKHIFFVTIG
jgi:outer membrane protein assembly factor BamB